jgi:Ca2+-binding EF-hand superfamily protein
LTWVVDPEITNAVLEVWHQKFKRKKELPLKKFMSLMTSPTIKDLTAQYPQLTSQESLENVFQILDEDSNGFVTAQEVVVGLTVICKGTKNQKAGCKSKNTTSHRAHFTYLKI